MVSFYVFLLTRVPYKRVKNWTLLYLLKLHRLSCVYIYKVHTYVVGPLNKILKKYKFCCYRNNFSLPHFPLFQTLRSEVSDSYYREIVQKLKLYRSQSTLNQWAPARSNIVYFRWWTSTAGHRPLVGNLKPAATHDSLNVVSPPGDLPTLSNAGSLYLNRL